MSPSHSIGFCPICGGGLCGIRACGSPASDPSNKEIAALHGFIVCDECDAIWLQPDLASRHQYPNAVDPRCPICREPLWGDQGRWADSDEIDALRWRRYVCPDLDLR